MARGSRAKPGTIEVAWRGGPRPADTRAVRAAARAALRHGGRPELELSIVLVDDAELAALHGRFLGDPTPTDVLSFELGGGGGPQAEIVASSERAAAVAKRRGISARRELLLYVVHGALHLCGYDDGDPRSRRRMRAAERTVLAALGPGNARRGIASTRLVSRPRSSKSRSQEVCERPAAGRVRGDQ